MNYNGFHQRCYFIFGCVSPKLKRTWSYRPAARILGYFPRLISVMDEQHQVPSLLLTHLKRRNEICVRHEVTIQMMVATSSTYSDKIGGFQVLD